MKNAVDPSDLSSFRTRTSVRGSNLRCTAREALPSLPDVLAKRKSRTTGWPRTGSRGLWDLQKGDSEGPPCSPVTTCLCSLAPEFSSARYQPLCASVPTDVRFFLLPAESNTSLFLALPTFSCNFCPRRLCSALDHLEAERCRFTPLFHLLLSLISIET